MFSEIEQSERAFQKLQPNTPSILPDQDTVAPPTFSYRRNRALNNIRHPDPYVHSGERASAVLLCADIKSGGPRDSVAVICKTT